MSRPAAVFEETPVQRVRRGSRRAAARAAVMALALAAHVPAPAVASTPADRSGTGSPPAQAVVAGRTEPDVIELRLVPAAAATVRVLGRAATGVRLGLGAVDGVAASLGAWFEPEFAGETAPRDARDIDFTAFWRVHLPDARGRASALARFAALPEVAGATPIPVLPVQLVPDDSLWPGAWYFSQPSGHDIHAPAAWNLTTGDSSVVIAIIDTGILHHHPDLAGQFWTNTAEAQGVPGVDDDHNGFVDDVWGWDFVRFDSGTGIYPGEDWRDQDPDPDDFSSHGTAVAGLAAAASNNHIGVTGTAWHARLMALRASYSSTTYPGGETDMSFAAQAVRYATRMGAAVINCSFASQDYAGLDSAVTAAVRAGVTVVSAAGNNGTPHHVADREDVLTVAASDETDALAAFSNRGRWVDVSAPGTNLSTTAITRPGTDSLGIRQPWYTNSAFGTSFATPLVTGAVALVQSLRRARGEPPLLPEEMIMLLRQTADDITAQNPGGGFGAGRVNALRALTEPLRSHVVRTGEATVGGAVVLHDGAGAARVVCLTRRALLVLDPVRHDTLAVVALPHFAVPGVAAADLGHGHGDGVFVALEGGTVMGLYANGRVRPGWPVSMTGSPAAGPAIGDLDGDGVPEIVCPDVNADVWAWHLDGTRVRGFPVKSGGLAGLDAAVALADLDGAPGLEVVAGTLGGNVYAFHGDGTRVSGWPVFYGGFMHGAVVARRADGSPLVLVPTTHTLLAFDRSGAVVFTRFLSGFAVGDPVLADLDGDGEDEVLIGAMSPGTLYAYHLNGDPVAGQWPRAVPGDVLGEAVVGPLGPGGAPVVLAYRYPGELLAVDAGGDSLGLFPQPGAVGMDPTLADVDADGGVDVVAGAGAAGTLYIYDGGASPLGAGAWTTPRGSAARTGCRAGAPGLGPVDDVPPAAPAGIAVAAVTETTVAVAWQAPDEGGGPEPPDAYEVEARAGPSVATITLMARAAVGGIEHAVFGGLRPGTRYAVTVRAVDGSGNVSANSAPFAVTTVSRLVSGPVGVAIACVIRPSATPVSLTWRGSGGTQRVVLLDITGRRVRALDPGPGLAGTLAWDGRDGSGAEVRSGIYFARFECAAGHAMTHVVLIR
jgi:subtilisin family serine protease